MLQSLILVFALCTDTFVASLAYGANQVHVSWGKVALLNGICSGCLGAALGMGSLIDAFIPENLTKVICFVCLFTLNSCVRRDLSFSLSGLKVIVSIYGNPMAADADGSLSLGWKETVFLAFAMSIDSLVAGTMAAFLDIPAGLTLLLSFLVGMCMMYAGLWLGAKVASRWKCDLSWISGALLMILALTKILA